MENYIGTDNWQCRCVRSRLCSYVCRT